MYARFLIMKCRAVNIFMQENLAIPELEDSEIKERQTSPLTMNLTLILAILSFYIYQSHRQPT